MQGGIPALSNFHSRADHFQTIYLDNPSLDNPAGVAPQTSIAVADGELELPAFREKVSSLAQTVPVDYLVPGCPPESARIWEIVETLIAGGQRAGRREVHGVRAMFPAKGRQNGGAVLPDL